MTTKSIVFAVVTGVLLLLTVILIIAARFDKSHWAAFWAYTAFMLAVFTLFSLAAFYESL